jgi:hypothetical protein
VQRAAEPHPVPAGTPAQNGAAPTVPVLVQREETVAAAEPGPASAAAPGATAGPGDPEELVKKLFDPLLRRLKIELRLDRERRGRLTDLSH